ncbi:CDP-diacylglycerol--serine O-phosphatidyltransferase [Motiliproteus coralliicola]|uniref:CDP-diacylglycerol--serine O-phosphatidyltransferase n=1 Tax=Motiliproteus coralliicola TaxID=2283196 RepID=A0A369WLN4_9GAMM|nr:CDP-diacylglycerol--serine O-phosphatidyltransferase [Motiliproteus coralliicola]RDE22371.1 CDP-diacylglycerol--serine O-phosphatidyltransferase [Motiliproteus coralliicola]
MSEQQQPPVDKPDPADTVKPSKPKARSRGIYLLPNLFTSAALFSGFFAVIAAMNGSFEKAAIAIFVAMVLDGLDGRVARMTNTQSEFGAQYDSLADMVSFGVAPALVAFSWALHSVGKIGWFAAFIYVAGAALRLARFNTQIGSVDKRFFIGLPSPAAAAVVAGMVWVGTQFEINADSYALVISLIVALSGILMVSNFHYHSFKEVDLKGKVPFVVLLGVVMLIAVISIDPATLLWLIFVVYGCSGPVQAVLRYRKKSAR